tara:strand:+ start:2801 stop:3334 length:534 start_codon:yes stop_codon:yes gene_type:complete
MQKLKNIELKRKNLTDFKMAKKTPLIIILDNVRSMNNVGSVFRSADAFLLEKIYLCGITAKPPHREIEKTALGSTKSIEWEHNSSTLDVIKDLKKNGVIIIAIEQTKESIFLENFKPISNQRYAFVLGNEVKGVSEKVLTNIDSAIEIAQFGTKHSLNISVCAGIIIWDFFNKINNL